MKFNVGDKVKDNGKGYPVSNGGLVGTVTGFKQDKVEPSITYIMVNFDPDKNEWPYVEEELEHA